ncbi:NAD-binding protein [Curtobacterium pusillum]|uniref:NAD-binding protein n=1 Tax=Curtobacterium pusillum TaxID=69373 RepID=UPI001643CC21|nr:NAD-binding protein [Curtobacterium pusillum]
MLDDLADDGGVRIIGDDPAHAQVVKLLVNALWFAHATVTAEALQTAQRAGIKPAALQRLLVGTAGASAFSDRYLPRFLAGDDFATFGLDGVVTELRDVARMAAGLELPLLERSLSLHEAALAAFGPVPGELLAVRLLEERNGIPLRGQDDPDVSAR